MIAGKTPDSQGQLPRAKSKIRINTKDLVGQSGSRQIITTSATLIP